MKKIATIIVCLLSIGILQAQTVGKTTADQYRQLVKMEGNDFKPCSDKLVQWGFTYNPSGIIDIFTMQSHPFFRAEGQDTVGAILGVIDGKVRSLSGIFSSMEPSRTFALIVKASAIQQQIATDMGLTKYVCSVKGKVSNKFPNSHEELAQVLAEVSADDVSMVFESWKSADGKKTLTLIYNNKLYGKKKARSSARAELTLGLGVTPE